MHAVLVSYTEHRSNCHASTRTTSTWPAIFVRAVQTLVLTCPYSLTSCHTVQRSTMLSTIIGLMTVQFICLSTWPVSNWLNASLLLPELMLRSIGLGNSYFPTRISESE